MFHFCFLLEFNRNQYIPELGLFYKNWGFYLEGADCEELSGGYLETVWLCEELVGGYSQDFIRQVSWSFLERAILEFVLMMD